ncbi:MAG: DotU family type IV/VI secretion system protein [Acidobacteria bacterium]|nr:DotU family type IV/VI secretion system protein [Acidobacteriota bacterium]MBK8148820.1 DotU family type IV/VI secretion system protein [Acidobacteriota bacterium]MBK8810134.1 DotU family type IV/VI secretion system protein [Acidobacteriota bacterium]
MSERSNKNDLVAFAGPVFDLILRLKAGIVQPSLDLRPKIASLLEDFENRAERYRFSSKIIQVAKFALASFVDETVLTNNFHLKEEWEKYPLQLEYFGEQLAGNKFFEKLSAMIKQIDVTADAVEIYYVCMLLGFKGRYAVYEKDKFLAIMQQTANALVKAGKIRPVELSPHWHADDQPEPPKPKKMPAWAKVAAFGGLGFAFIVYLIMFVMTSFYLSEAMKKLPF